MFNNSNFNDKHFKKNNKFRKNKNNKKNKLYNDLKSDTQTLNQSLTEDPDENNEYMLNVIENMYKLDYDIKNKKNNKNMYTFHELKNAESNGFLYGMSYVITIVLGMGLFYYLISVGLTIHNIKQTTCVLVNKDNYKELVNGNKFVYYTFGYYNLKNNVNNYNNLVKITKFYNYEDHIKNYNDYNVVNRTTINCYIYRNELTLDDFDYLPIVFMGIIVTFIFNVTMICLLIVELNNVHKHYN